jgi:hypothetical protein
MLFEIQRNEELLHMDLHRTPIRRKIDHPQAGRRCQFCEEFDPDFEQRKPMDQLVAVQVNDIASGHLTEDGHVKHRLVELRKMLNAPPPFLQNTSAA